MEENANVVARETRCETGLSRNITITMFWTKPFRSSIFSRSVPVFYGYIGWFSMAAPKKHYYSKWWSERTSYERQSRGWVFRPCLCMCLMCEVWCGLRRFSITDAMKENLWLYCMLWQLKLMVQTAGWRAANPPYYMEFPPSWLKYQHIAAIFPSTRAQSFNNLQNEGGRWEVIKVTYICLISEALPFTIFSRTNKKEQFIVFTKMRWWKQTTKAVSHNWH